VKNYSPLHAALYTSLGLCTCTDLLMKHGYHQSGQCSHQLSMNRVNKNTDLTYDQMFKHMWNTWRITSKVLVCTVSRHHKDSFQALLLCIV